MRPERKKVLPLIIARARELRRQGSGPEIILWSMLRNRQIAGLKFRRQHDIGRSVVDFFCADAKLVVEIDGLSHVGRGKRDAMRQRELEKIGLKVVRFTNDEVLGSSDLVVEAIVRAAGIDW